MALINGALQIGRSAIMASQAALSVVGNNMANAATPSYSRQRVTLSPTQYSEVSPGKYTGTGVTITSIGRLVDDALNGRIRRATSDAESQLVQQLALTRAEATFNELTETDLSSRLSQFFGTFSRLQTEPSNSTHRSNVLIEGQGLANFIRDIRSDLFNIQDDLDNQVQFQVVRADQLATQIAALNGQVVATEAGRTGSSAALRDQRDAMLKELSQLIGITTREVEGGAVNVFIGNDPLIQYSQSRGLTYEEKPDVNGNTISVVNFSDNAQAIDLSSGRIKGLLVARDDRLGKLIGDLDSWTSSLILELNQLHSLGQGQQGYTAVTSYFGVDDSTVSLGDMTESGVKWPVTNGVFNLHVYDSEGAIIRTEQIKVDIGQGGTDTTLASLVAQINAKAPELTASVDGSNRLNIQTTGSGYTFGFSGPSDISQATNVLAVLGINTFFQGSDGADIDIRSGLDEGHVVAGSDGQTTNGNVAGAIARLATQGVNSLKGLSLTDHFTAMIGRLGSDSRSAQDSFISADVVVQTLEAERQSVSGVSMDEEAINMMMYQRMLQASSRYVNLINQMLDEVLSLV